MTVKKSRIIKSLESFEEISNLSTELNEVIDDKADVIGSFDYDDLHYAFFYSESKPLIICEVSLMFTYEEFSFNSELAIYKVLDSFNAHNIAIKVSVLEQNVDKKEQTLEFSCGSLLDPEMQGESLMDLQPSIAILKMLPIKLSSEMKKQGVQHNFLNESDDDSEEG